MLTIDQSYDRRSVDLPVGQVLELRLPENPTTGFSWSFESNGGPACAVVNDQFVGSGTRPGRGGQHAWQIRGVQVGACQFSLAYRRPWEAGVPSAQVFHVQVNVTP